LPAITHVDGSARPQTVTPASHPRFAALLEAFQARTGCPMLLNTSFNMRGEPIVCTPVDVLIGMAQAKLDALVLEDWLIDREQLPAHWADLLPYWESHPPKAFRDATSPLGENLYTFV
jgi:carbamoyltransferase